MIDTSRIFLDKGIKRHSNIIDKCRSNFLVCDNGYFSLLLKKQQKQPYKIFFVMLGTERIRNTHDDPGSIKRADNFLAFIFCLRVPVERMRLVIFLVPAFGCISSSE